MSSACPQRNGAWFVPPIRGSWSARMSNTSGLFIKGKFFEFPELLGGKGSRWTKPLRAMATSRCFA